MKPNLKAMHLKSLKPLFVTFVVTNFLLNYFIIKHLKIHHYITVTVIINYRLRLEIFKHKFLSISKWLEKIEGTRTIEYN